MEEELLQIIYNSVYETSTASFSLKILIQYLSMYLSGDAYVNLCKKRKNKTRQLFLECSVSELHKRQQKVSLEKVQEQMRNYKGLGNQHTNEHTG